MSAATGTLDRRAAVKALLADRGGLLVISGLGSSSYDVFDAGDHAGNFYLWGAMGGAAMVGLGLALAQPKRPVLVVTGDGEQLMGIGSLLTIATKQPGNLSIAVLDNGHFGETGMQVSHAGRGLEFDRVAAACGFSWTARITDLDGVTDLQRQLATRDGVKLAVIKIAAAEAPRVLPPRDGSYVKNRFRAALGFQPI